MKPEEGYDLTWISAERRSDKTPCQVKPTKKRTARPVSMGDFSSGTGEVLSTRQSCAGEENKLSGETSKKSKSKCSPSEKAARPLAEDLVGCRIKAWEPEDKMFYEGSITSYDKSENKHRINCDDGSVKDMNLSVERWEPIRDDADEQKTLADVDDDCPRETPSSDLAKVSGQDVSCNTQLRSDQVNQNDIDVRNDPSHENRTSAFAAHKSLSPPTRRRGR
nr:uncharacterized protein LOC109191612 [Ipomoea trifida]